MVEDERVQFARLAQIVDDCDGAFGEEFVQQLESVVLLKTGFAGFTANNQGKTQTLGSWS